LVMSMSTRTRNIMNIYEKTAIIGTRTEQIISGAPTTLTAQELEALPDRKPLTIVKKELELRKLPFKICRTLPNGEKEYWKLENLIIL
jgi:DNA-directed RNA polymerase subunit K/omega